MAEFIASWNILNDKSDEMKRYANQLRQYANSVENIMNNLNLTGKGTLSLRSSLRIQMENMKKLQNKCSSISILLDNAAQTYRNTEKEILNDIKPESLWNRFWNGTLESKKFVSLITLPIINSLGFGHIKFGSASESVALKPKYGEYKDSSLKKVKEKQKTIYYERNKDIELFEKKGTIFEAKLEKKKEYSLLEGDYSIKNDAGEFYVDAKAATVEAHGNLSGGLYAYSKDEQGNTIRTFAPGVEAEIGASASLFELKANTRWGLGEDNNMLGVYGDGEVTVAKASAEGKATVAFFDENGKVNPQVYGKAEAEITLAEAKGTAGVSILGVDAGVSGSVSVGVGAHAEAGYTDGKLKVDVGASFGFGVSVGFEVDVGGAVDAVTGMAQSVWNDITSWKPKWW